MGKKTARFSVRGAEFGFELTRAYRSATALLALMMALSLVQAMPSAVGAKPVKSITVTLNGPVYTADSAANCDENAEPIAFAPGDSGMEDAWIYFDPGVFAGWSHVIDHTGETFQLGGCHKGDFWVSIDEGTVFRIGVNMYVFNDINDMADHGWEEFEFRADDSEVNSRDADGLFDTLLNHRHQHIKPFCNKGPKHCIHHHVVSSVSDLQIRWSLDEVGGGGGGPPCDKKPDHPKC